MKRLLSIKDKLPKGQPMTLALGVVLGAAAVAAVMGAVSAAKKRRLMKELRRSLPVMRAAAQKYLDENEVEEQRRAAPVPVQQVSDR